MKTTKETALVLVTGVLLTMAVSAADPVSEVSGEVSLNTCSLSSVTAVEDEELDTRSFTVDWSTARQLNTKKIVGALLLLR